MGQVIDHMINKWEDIKYGESQGCLRRDGMSNFSEFLKAAFWTGVAE